jgi:phosphoserine phosphatase
MAYVATLIPSTPFMVPTMLTQLLAVLEERGQFPAKLDWLVPQRVVDLWFRDHPAEDSLNFARELCEQHATDMVLQAAEHRTYRMLISDMDSTMITVECIDELADFVGKKAEVAQITERAMNGELDFASALTERVALLKGLPVASLQKCFDERVTFTSGAKALVDCMKRQGAYCLLISGGFDFFTARVAEKLGFDAHLGNTLEIENSQLTGRVIPPISGKEAKLAALQHHAAERGIRPEEIMAVGDGANDLQMLLAAGFGVAYRAKPTVRRQAKHAIDYNDLSALIYAQGLTF